jgi:hypothetical protein
MKFVIRTNVVAGSLAVQPRAAGSLCFYIDAVGAGTAEPGETNIWDVAHFSGTHGPSYQLQYR